MSVRLILGDCRQMLRTIPDASVDSCVTDPPYHLVANKKEDPRKASPDAAKRARRGFMGMKWDGGAVAFEPETWAGVLRVLKPGAHLLAFGGTRTYHRMVCAIEDAGFEIRDQIGWLYGSGFPKSHNLDGEWEGWGTALKPAWEPIVVARKPFKGTVEANVTAQGTGAYNIDGCRIETSDVLQGSGTPPLKFSGNNSRPFHESAEPLGCTQHSAGRWPANIIHDGSDEVLAAFPDAPGQLADASTSTSTSTRKTQNVYGAMRRGRGEEASADSDNEGAVGFKMKPGMRRLDDGSAARFFYCAKADREDRNDGCYSLPKKPMNWSSGEQNPGSFQAEGTDRSAHNPHPTVKPTDLMRYLCKLVTPPNGIVVDPFMGSGSTGRGAIIEGFSFIGIEEDPDYIEIARARIRAAGGLFYSEVA